MKKLLIVCISLVVTYSSISQDSIKIGIASQYAKYFNGRRTATGEIYKGSKLTCASNVFKLNTVLEVTNVKKGLSIIVRVNDRMHPRMARKGRIVDLSRSAAKALDFEEGLIKVVAKVI